MPKKRSSSNSQLRSKIEKLIGKYERKSKKEEQILHLSQTTQKCLKVLLDKIPTESDEVNPQLNDELHQIHKNFKQGMKSIKKDAKKERKYQKKMEKKERKNERKGKGKGKEKGESKKENKKNKYELLDQARIEELPRLGELAPECKVNESEGVYRLIVDGWNIVGCDKIARKAMRGRRKEGAKRMIFLLSQFGLSENVFKNYKIEIHFDGNGESETQIFNSSELNINLSIDVKFSGKNEIVDDRLVRELGAVKNVEENANVIVVTSDRELTLRLNKIGVKVIRSGTFYKKYLKQFAFDDSESSESENKKEKKERKEKKPKEKKNKKNGNEKGKGKGKGRKHWKKYIKNRFSDNSSSSSSSSSGFHFDFMDDAPAECDTN